MEKNKVTKKMILSGLAAYFEQNDFDVTVDDVTITTDDVLDYINKTIAQLDRKNEKARERAAKVKAEGDELRERVAAVLTDDFKTIKEIVDEINDPDVTTGKVTARLTQLCKADLAHKTEVKVGDNRKVKAYAAGPAAETETEAEEE